LPPAVLAALAESRSGPTWDRYVGAIRPWFDQAAAATPPYAALPADPLRFAEWLVNAGKADRGYSQTKIRCVAISALSNLVGVQPPMEHALPNACRKAACRTKRHRRGQVTPVLRHELPCPLSPQAASGTQQAVTPPPRGEPGIRRGHRTGSSPGTRLRRRAATARHMALLHGACLRYDDTREGQLGDILHFPDVVDINVFGSKTDRLLMGQVAILPSEPGDSADRTSGRQSLLNLTRCGLQRLGALTPDVLAAIGARLQARHPRSSAGPEAMATWPPDIRALTTPLYRQGLPVHLLPYYGPWLWEPIGADFDLSRSCSTAQFQRWAQDTFAASPSGGRALARVGAHSFRRGRAAELAPGGLGPAALTRVLRHTSAGSAAPYVLQSVRVTTTASAMRVATHRSVIAGRRGLTPPRLPLTGEARGHREHGCEPTLRARAAD